MLQKYKLRIWWMAARPKTLPAAAATVFAGIGAAISEQVFSLGPALASLAGALLLQIGANLANDVFDFQRGADTEGRLGPLRVTQAGLLTPGEVKFGMWITFGLAALIGIYLTWVAGLPVLIIGGLSILAAVIYTGGPWPIGYYGLGDLFVFIFFGLISVAGTYYVQAKSISPLAIWAAIPMGFLTVAILVVNNLRDIDNDRKVGKRTLAVRFGVRVTRWEYLICLAGAYIVPVWMAISALISFWVILPLLTLPLAIRLIRSIWVEHGRALNKVLAGTGQLELIFGILFAIGMIL
jgi:1,4-dihydroxy-2-naphthoate octaprenyltransferase